MDNHSLAFVKILDTCDYLEDRGIEQRALKRRDKREPGRRRKEIMEDRLFAIVMRYFREQRKQIKEHLEAWYPGRKANLPPYIPDSVWQNDKAKAALIKLLGEAIIDGIALFGETQKIGIDYTLINAEALDWAHKYGFDLIKGINATTKTAVEKAISSFVETPGMTIGDVVNILPYNKQRALTIATTEITRTYAEGNAVAGHELENQFPNVKVVEIWFTNNDDRVCDICGPVDGEEVEIDTNFSNGLLRPPAHVNCLLGDSLVSPIGGIAAGSKRWYEGDIIIIETLKNKLTITPNHPVLTLRGWINAGKLESGDYVFGYDLADIESLSVTDNNQNVVSSIEDIFSSLDLDGFRMPTSAPDFHGDGLDSNIAVIRPNRKIVDKINPQFSQPLTQSQLIIRDMAFSAAISSKSADAEFIERNLASPSGIMGSENLDISLVIGHPLPFSKSGIGRISGIDTGLEQSLSESPAVDSQFLRESILALPGNISLDKIVDIRNEHFSGHVYNLQTETGLYFANYIIISNCRCWTTTSTKIGD